MIISRTPFRISFFGGGTDYPEYFHRHGGAVLGTAIDKFVYLAATRFFSQLFDYSIRLAYRQVECVADLEQIQHAPFRECLRYTGVTKHVEVDCMASLPSSVGLGTSSSFVVGVLNVLYAFQGRVVHPMELARQAIELERDILHEAVGCQDQAFAALGGFNLLQFRKNGDIAAHAVTLSPARLQEFENHLMIVFTGIRRRASGIAAQQIRKISANGAVLARMQAMVDRAYDVLAGGNSLAEFGRLLHEGWTAKQSLDASVSNATIDALYARGIEAGALGGKLLGAGGGGFVLLFVPPERRAAVRAALGEAEEIPIRINAEGTSIVHDDSMPSLRRTDLPAVRGTLRDVG